MCFVYMGIQPATQCNNNNNNYGNTCIPYFGILTLYFKALPFSYYCISLFFFLCTT